MTDFVSALQDKYVNQEVLDDQTYIPHDKKITTKITLVGFGKVASVQKQLSYLTNIDLSGQDISELGDLTSLANNLSAVKILNLTGNHIDWQQLMSLLHILPRLDDLIVSSNRLNSLHYDDLVYPDTKFRQLKSLTIGQTRLNWRSLIQIISQIWKTVSAIDLWDCQLSADDMLFKDSNSSQQVFLDNISSIKLSYNNFMDAKWLCQMGNIMNLVDLDLSRCKLKEFFVNDQLAATLKNLQNLNISYNNISDWMHISSLMHLKKLRFLVCHENPFFICEKLSKPFIIGKIGTLDVINREEISKNNRRDSEILYLRKIHPIYLEYKKGTCTDFPLLHPRFNELAEIYGLPEDPSTNEQTDKYVTVQIKYLTQTIQKKVPRDMRVSSLKMLSKRLLKLPPSSKIKMTCHNVDPSGEVLSYDLDGDSQTLHYYSVRNNQELILSKVS